MSVSTALLLTTIISNISGTNVIKFNSSIAPRNFESGVYVVTPIAPVKKNDLSIDWYQSATQLYKCHWKTRINSSTYIREKDCKIFQEILNLSKKVKKNILPDLINGKWIWGLKINNNGQYLSQPKNLKWCQIR